MINWIKKLLLGWIISFLQKKKDEIGKQVENKTETANNNKKPEVLLPPKMRP